MNRFWYSLVPDAVLVRRALADDAGALESLVLRYQKRALAIASSLGIPASERDDVVQEAFVRALESLPRLREPTRFGPWFLAIVRNASRDRLRALSESRGRVPLESMDTGTAGAVDDEELGERVWRAVADLPESIREAIFLYYHDGESVRAVARFLGISRAAVLKRLQRGRELLRERLWREMEETLRDMLPSARDWKRRGRRLTLVLVGALAALGGPSRATASASVLSPAEPLSRLIAGGLAMSGKKLAVSLVVAMLLLLTGVSIFHVLLTTGPEGPRPARGTDVPAVATNRPADPLEEGLRATGAGNAEETISETAAVTPPASIAGTVSSQDGEPIAGARVIALHTASWGAILDRADPVIWTHGDLTAELRALFDEYRRQAERLPATESDSDGAYRFDDLPPGEYRVLAGHGDFLPELEPAVLVAGGSTSRCDLRLEEGSSITGHVVGVDGAPVAGAVIRARESSVRRLRPGDRRDALVESWARGEFLVSNATTPSGPDGAFRVASLPSALHDLFAGKEGFADARLDDVGPGASATVIMSPGLSVRGTVVDAGGETVEGAVASLRPIEEARRAGAMTFVQEPVVPERVGPDLADRFETRTAADGAFELAGLSPGRHELLVRAEGHPELRAEVELVDAPIELGVIVLEEARAISGTVRDPRGAPLRDALVWIARRPAGGLESLRPGDTASPPLVEARSDGRGRFALPGLAPGVYTVRAVSRGLAGAVLDGVEAGASGIELRLGEGFTLAGTVVDAGDRSPVEGATVELVHAEDLSPCPERGAVTGADGSFEICGLGDNWAAVALRIRHPDYADHVERSLNAAARQEVEIALERPEAIDGAVFDLDGAPVPDAAVRLEFHGMHKAYLLETLKSGMGRGRTDPDGAFSIAYPHALRRAMMSPYLTELVASRPGVGVGRVLLEGETPESVEVVLRPFSTLSGTVRDGAGGPVAGARITARRTFVRDGEKDVTAVVAACTSRSGGGYRLASLEPGLHDLEVRRLGFAPLTIEKVEIGEDPLELDLVLESGATLAGRVVDTLGRPVEAAEVCAFEPREADGLPRSHLRVGRRHSEVGIASARTETDGTYLLDDLPARALTLVARAPGFEPSPPLRIEAGGAPPDLVVEAHAAIAGSVVEADSGRPVGSFRLFVRRRSADRRMIHDGIDAIEYLPREFADPAGRFRIDGLREGRYYIGAHARGLAPAVTESTLSPGEETRIVFRLSRGLAVSGIVLDAASGLPLEDVSVRFYPWSSDAAPNLVPLAVDFLDALTGADGRFAIDGLVPGPHRLYARHPDFESPVRYQEIEVGGPQDPFIEVLMRLKSGGRMAGTIANHRVDGSFHQRLVLTPIDGANVEPVTCDVGWWNGDYEKSDVPPGAYAIHFSERFQTEKGKAMTERMGFYDHEDPELSVERKVFLGEVVIRPRETATFDATVPRE